MIGFKRREQNAVRRYLLRQLSESEQRTLELRLLSDDALSEELDIQEDELIDEYLGGKLSRKQRARFEEIFLAHPGRQRKLQAALALRRYFDSFPAPPAPTIFQRLTSFINVALASLSSPALRAAVGVLAVSVVGLVIWRGFIYQSDLEKGLVALNEAYRHERLIKARVSGINYARFEVTRNGEPKRIDEGERTRSQLLLEGTLKRNPDAASHHAVGQFYLLQKDFDKAIDHLEQARAGDNNNPQIYADLGAAYLERAQRDLDRSRGGDFGSDTGQGVVDLGRSLEYLKRALELDPNLLPALFNRGLVHEQQMLYREAEADWRAYLEKDSTSQWAVEARESLKRLEERNQGRGENAVPDLQAFLAAYVKRDEEGAWQIYKRNYEPKGNKITKDLLDSVLADNSGRETEAVKALGYLGELQLRKTQDAYTSDLARFYSSITPGTRPLLVQARADFDDGYKLLSDSKLDESTKLLESSLRTFKQIGNQPESLAAEAALAHGAVVQPKLAVAQEILERIIPRCESLHYRWLLAEIISRRAHLQSNLNNYSEAFSDARISLQIFQEIDEPRGVFGGFVQLASLHVFLNDEKMSCSYLRQALSLTEKVGALPNQIWGLYMALGTNFTALQLHRAALDYQNEALRLAAGSLSALYISRSHQHIGVTLGALRQFDLALQHLRLAYEQGRPLSNERLGQNMMAQASLKLGDVYRASGDIPSALAAYDESSRWYHALKFGHYRYAAHKGKFLSYLAQNNDAMASQELKVVIDLFEEYRKRIVEERQKNVFFDAEQDIYDLAIDFTYSRLADPLLAYDYSEKCRARNLRSLMHSGAEVTRSHSGLDLRASGDAGSERASPLAASEIKSKIPDDVQLIQFSVLEKKLLIWYVKRNHIVPKPVEVSSAELTELVQTTLRKITWRDENGAAEGLRQLFRLLVEPIKDELDPNKVLCFIPDKFLHYAPFAALISSSSGRYLAQDYRVMVSPSATIFIEATNRALSITDENERLLAVGNPTFDRKANPNLADLPGAEREVAQLISTYPAHRSLVGPAATRNSILAELPRSDVAHFAAHFEVDSRSMLLSKLLLAPERGDRAQFAGLHAEDIYAMRLIRTRLVILSGCKTGIEQQFGGEGPIGFARAFLVAGVPVVVASLWPVESDATADLMIAFHRFRKNKNVSTTEALMRAQQEMLNSDNSLKRNPYYWAGFTVIGGYGAF